MANFKIVPSQRAKCPDPCKKTLGVKTAGGNSQWVGHISWTFEGWKGLDLDGRVVGPPRKTELEAGKDAARAWLRGIPSVRTQKAEFPDESEPYDPWGTDERARLAAWADRAWDIVSKGDG